MGHQDTLFVRTGRQYFKSCYVSGVVDFIFGDATAVFDRCEIVSRNKPGGYISAPSTLAGSTHGLVFLKCSGIGDPRMEPNTIWLGCSHQLDASPAPRLGGFGVYTVKNILKGSDSWDPEVIIASM